jgi:predicted RNA-binding protein Jag
MSTMPNTIQDQISQLIHITVGKIAIIKSLEFEKEGEQFRVCIHTDKNEIFLENQCEVLEAIQHFVRKIIHIKNPQDHSHFFLDIGYYNKNREYVLSIKTPELAQEVVLNKGRTVIMTHLSGFERLYVHNILADVNGLQTTSVGIDTNRKLLIIPTSETGSSSLDESTIFDLDTIVIDPNIDMFKNSNLNLPDNNENFNN